MSLTRETRWNLPASTRRATRRRSSARLPPVPGGDVLVYWKGNYVDVSKGMYDSSMPSFASSGSALAYAALSRGARNPADLRNQPLQFCPSEHDEGDR